MKISVLNLGKINHYCMLGLASVKTILGLILYSVNQNKISMIPLQERKHQIWSENIVFDPSAAQKQIFRPKPDPAGKKKIAGGCYAGG